MASHSDQSPPFTQKLLGSNGSQESKASGLMENDLASLLPASRRTKDNDLAVPACSSVLDSTNVKFNQLRLAAIHDWVDKETDLRRLADIHNWLWIAGRPMPPRPLHQQRLLNREIAITEKLDLHLI
ncbi:hypothetical protein CMEL01_16558 [Colletotrichum melonis]|uniref:Uncharacterized protein n=1 Tax=Colletotrichum melonis TaxID=1209925 RepID=A0AAI9UF61_9PEZI|nr:hypothetical protein CMEL01_16558 [Colletotrichum melonis]